MRKLKQSEKTDFLLELGVEELPALQLNDLITNLTRLLKNKLREAGLEYSRAVSYATPRRIAVLVYDLDSKQKDQTIEKRGPGLDRAFEKDGKPTKAALGFARSCGVEVADLEKLESEAGSWLLYRCDKCGLKTEELLPSLIKEVFKELPMKRSMRWGDHDEAFVRPVHWLVALYNNKVLPVEMFGLKASNVTYGHRFHHPEAITIKDSKKYAELLEKKGHVIADFEHRKELIRKQLAEVTTNSGVAVINEELLNEVTGVVEWPVALLGNFEERFLKMPYELLTLVMKLHQRYFHMVDHEGKLMANFITVSNIKSKNPALIISGNEKVMRARLSDAEFFYQEDLKERLEFYVAKLKDVVFQDKLGTMHDKMVRISSIASYLAPLLEVDVKDAKQAAFLCKADLVTSMVGEFPELQGVMGYNYALSQGEPVAVSIAIKEHYLPRFSGDSLPNTPLGVVLAIADRVDTLMGVFGIGQAPTGDKDPFALRRAALSLVKIILHEELEIDLKKLFTKAESFYGEQGIALPNKKAIDELLTFIFERARGVLAGEGIETKVFNAVLAESPVNLTDFRDRAISVQRFLELPEAEDLAMAHKRVNNILKKSSLNKKHKFSDKLFKEDIEKELYQVLNDLLKVTEALCEEGFYEEALTLLAEIKPVLDEFFDKVMVMAEDEALRNNRLLLLQKLQTVLSKVADISLLV